MRLVAAVEPEGRRGFGVQRERGSENLVERKAMEVESGSAWVYSYLQARLAL